MNGVAINQNMATIGLAGQPNTGKSTLFNKLTGSKQHVGNWPGKTIEKKEGLFFYNNRNYNIVDLPGTYSLTANSAEEIISRDCIVSNDIDTLIVMIDASQLNRSMYLLSEVVGMNVSTIVVLNMMDIAEQKGKRIDVQKLEKSLGVPIISMVAAKGKGVESLYHVISEVEYQNTLLKTESFFNHYKEMFGEDFTHLVELLKKGSFNKYSEEWAAVKLLESDMNIFNTVMNSISDKHLSEISIILERNKDGMSKSAQCKHLWIENNLKNVFQEKNSMVNFKRSAFDKLSTHKYLGIPLGILMIVLGIVASFIIAMPLMGVITGWILPKVSFGLQSLLVQLNILPWLSSLITEALVPGAFMAFFMTLFVGAFSLVLGFMEDIGYMARIAYMFDRTMSKVGLHGKAIMPFISCFGCSIAGISGTRVIDSWQKRILTMASCMVIPCAAMWGVIGLLTSLFFGTNAVWVIISLFVVSIAHIKITTWFFSKRYIKEEDHTGLIMEIPPYHKPNWKTIFSYTWNKMKHVFKKALTVITLVAVVVWILSYSSNGVLEDSVIYSIGKFLEPIGKVVGLDWKLLIAFIFSMMGKEAALGVIAMLFGVGSGVNSVSGMMVSGALQYDVASLSTAIRGSVSQASALAFTFAFFFNVKCMAAMASIKAETHSVRWTLRIAIYYILTALIIGGIAYRVGQIIF